MMNGYYRDLKNDVGVEEQNTIDDNEDNLDEILKKLKPNTTPSNFKEFLQVKGNCNRTQKWRAVSRKIYAKEHKEAIIAKEDHDFYNTDPQNMKVGQLYKAFQTNYRKSNQPMLQAEEPKQLKIINTILERQTDIQPCNMIARLPNGEFN